MPLLSELPFEPIGDAAPGAATGFTVDGVDLANIYAPASVGVPAGVTTGFTAAGADLGTLFAAIGSTKKLLDTWKGTYSDVMATTLVATATAFVTFKADGTYLTNYGTGRWLSVGLVPSDYEVIAEVVSGTFDDNDMIAYAQLNTNRSLELTTSAGPTIGFSQETAKANITIRKITEPTTLVTGSVTLIVNAESYGSGPPP